MAEMHILENLGEEFRCTLCKEILRNPKNLACGHTFCQDPCLKGLIKNRKGNLSCPTCKKQTAIPPSSNADDFPDNHILKGVIDKFVNAPTLKKCTTHSLPMNFFCLKCQKAVCAGCLVGDHDSSKDNIKGLNDIVAEKRKYHMAVEIQLNKAFDLQMDVSANYRRRKETLKVEAKVLEGQIKISANEAISFIGANEQTMLIYVQQELENQLKQLNKSENASKMMCAQLRIAKDANQSLVQALTNNNIPTKISTDVFKAKVREVDNASMVPDKFTSSLGLYHIKLPCSFQFADVKGCKVVGVVWLTPAQLIWVIDQREKDAGINMWCVSPREKATTHWSHKVDPEDKKAPLIMCPISYRFRKFNHVLLGCGKEIFVMYFRWSGEAYDAVEHVSKRTLQLPKDAVICAICCHDELSKRASEFYVATTRTSHLLRFSHKYELIGTINCSEIISSCSALACVDAKLAVINQIRDEVLLIRQDEQQVTLIEKFSPPEGCVDAIPLKVIWDGGGFVVLWKALEPGKTNSMKWYVAVYKRSGEFVRICGEGSCQTVGIPVGITRCVKEVAVCFACEALKIFDIDAGVTPV